MTSILMRIWAAIVSLGNTLRSGQTELEKTVQSIRDGQIAIAGQLGQVLDILIPGPAVGLVFTVRMEDGTTLEGVTTVKFRDDQLVGLTIQPVDKKGKPAVVDGIPVWAGSDDTVGLVVAAPDGLSATLTGVAPGVGRVVVTADADLGAGVTAITGILEFEVTGGAAATITITAGTPADQ